MDQLTPKAQLAKAVTERRDELGLSRQRVATKAEMAGQRISVQTLANMEKGERDRYAPDTWKGLDAGLDWPEGTGQAIFAGKTEPKPEAKPLARHLDELEAAHMDKLVSIAVPVQKLTDAEALMVVLRCLSDDQYAMFARAVQADDRFAAIS